MKMKYIAIPLALISTSFATTSLTLFSDVNCTGVDQGTAQFNVTSEQLCVNLGTATPKSINFTGVPHEIQFFFNDGSHIACPSDPLLVLENDSGCGTAPPGFDWGIVIIS